MNEMGLGYEIFAEGGYDPLESWTKWGGLLPVLFERLCPSCSGVPKTKKTVWGGAPVL